MIRTGKLHRLCIKCNKTFEPSGKATKICNNCKKGSWLDEIYKKQNENK